MVCLFLFVSAGTVIGSILMDGMVNADLIVCCWCTDLVDYVSRRSCFVLVFSTEICARVEDKGPNVC